MKLKLKNTPEQVELIRAMGSKDPAVAREASEAFAAFIGPVVQKVLEQVGTASLIYTDNEFDEDDNPSIPLDLYHNEGAGHVSVWAQNVAGGLPSSEVSGLSELKVSTYRLDSAVSFLKRYARRTRLDVVSKATERMAQEVLLKQERNAWAVILKALAEASTKGVKHVTASGTADSFKVADLNKLMTRIKRVNASFGGGTTADAKGLTDLFVSPEIMQEIRGFAYNPVNDKGNASFSGMGLPEGVREEIYRSAGASEIYGVTIHEMLELGVSKKYNVLFGELAAGLGHVDAGGSNFDSSNDEILVGVDLSREAFIRPVARQSESGGIFTAIPDDQFVARSEKIGFYGFVEEGRVCVDARAVGGIIV
jgi:hypothetical protein